MVSKKVDIDQLTHNTKRIGLHCEFRDRGYRTLDMSVRINNVGGVDISYIVTVLPISQGQVAREHYHGTNLVDAIETYNSVDLGVNHEHIR